MTLRDHHSRADELSMRDLCADIHEEDGMSPKDWDKQPGQHDDPHRTERLCAQIRRCIQSCIQIIVTDLTQAEARIERVEPISNAAGILNTKRLRVTVSLGMQDQDKAAAVRLAITGNAGMVRCAVAETITRKRTPSLIWVVVVRENENE